MVLRLEALRERLTKLEEVLGRLREISEISRDDFFCEYRNQWLAERGLELAAQAALDIGNHILAGEFGQSAAEYQGIIQGLASRSVISAGLAEQLKGLGGFRNVLAHGYLQIDPEKVYAALQRSQRDFTDFQAEILEWLDRRA